MPQTVLEVAPAPSTPAITRQRFRQRRTAAAVAVLGLAVLVALLLFAFSGAGEPPPATGAAALVPSDALIYVHLSTDPSRPAVKRAQALLARLPDRGAALSGLMQRLVAVVGGSTTTDFGRDIRPWLGREAAFALLDTGGTAAGSVVILDVGNRLRLNSFLTRQGTVADGSYHGAALGRYATGAELALTHGYLVVGQPDDVRAAVDAASGAAPSLQSDAAYRQAASDEPSGRVLDAYVSAAGVNRALGASRGVLGALGAVLSQPALLGSAMSLSAEAHGLRIHVHSALDPVLARLDQSRARPFEPTLQDVLPSGSTLMLDVPDLTAAAPAVLRATGRLGLLSAVPDLLHRLGTALAAQGVNTSAFLSLFRHESALALARGTGAPALVIVTRTRDAAKARVTLANLEAPVSQLFAPSGGGPGLAPEVNDVNAGGVSIHQLQLAPALQVDYAVFDRLIVISTSERGIVDVAARTRSLGKDAGYRKVLGDRPGHVRTLAFADFSQLLSLAEQTSLANSAGYSALKADLESVHAAGMYSSGGEADTTAELFLQIP